MAEGPVTPPAAVSQELEGLPDWVTVHPAAARFPMMSDAEIAALEADIREHGLKQGIVLYLDVPNDAPHRKRKERLADWCRRAKIRAQLLDGRNRVTGVVRGNAKHPDRSLEDWGTEDALPFVEDLFNEEDEGGVGVPPGAVLVYSRDGVDPFDFVISANIHRRHLTADQKRDVVVELLKERPERSDRQTAKIANVSPTFVGKVRAEGEGAGTVSTVDTRTGAGGVSQPAHKPRVAPESPEPPFEPAKPETGAVPASKAATSAPQEPEREPPPAVLELVVEPGPVTAPQEPATPPAAPRDPNAVGPALLAMTCNAPPPLPGHPRVDAVITALWATDPPERQYLWQHIFPRFKPFEARSPKQLKKLDDTEWRKFWDWAVAENQRRTVSFAPPMLEPADAEKSAVASTAGPTATPELEITTLNPTSEAVADAPLIASFEAINDLKLRADIYRTIMGMSGASDPESEDNEFFVKNYQAAPDSEQRRLRAYFVQLKTSPVQQLAQRV